MCVRGMEIGNIAGRTDIDVPSDNKLLIISSINSTCFDFYEPSSRTTVQESRILNRIFLLPNNGIFLPW
jgi:hypothetical protein